MQNAFASYQSMQFIGLFSFAPALRVHVWAGELHATAVCSAAAGAGRAAVHPVSPPGAFEVFGVLPRPRGVKARGYAAPNLPHPPPPASRLSRRKAPTIAG